MRTLSNREATIIIGLLVERLGGETILTLSDVNGADDLELESIYSPDTMQTRITARRKPATVPDEPKRSFDMGDPEPPDVVMLNDELDQTDESSSAWSKTYTPGEWKGYKDGGKVYLQWDELTRRYGPLHAPDLTIGGKA